MNGRALQVRGPGDNASYDPAMPLRFDADALDEAEWQAVEDIDREPTGPEGLAFPEGTTTLQRLVAWASWGYLTVLYGDRPDD